MVGRDAKALAWLAALVPDRIHDRMLMKQFAPPQQIEGA